MLGIPSSSPSQNPARGRTSSSGTSSVAASGARSSFHASFVGDPNLPRGSRASNRFFDAAAFADPGMDVKGTSGPGTVRGPGQNSWNLNLAKTFRATEKLRVEFRSEMYNFFNHTQFKEINTEFSTFSGTTFGWITGAHDGRYMQFGLRITF